MDIISDINVLVFFIILFIKTMDDNIIGFTGVIVMNLLICLIAERVFTYVFLANILKDVRAHLY